MLQFLLGYFLPPVAIPLIGGTLLLLALRVTNVSDVTFLRCWLIYVAAFAYGFLAFILLNFLFQWQTMAAGPRLAVYLGATWPIHALVVPLLIRKRGSRTIVAEEAAIALTNLVVLAAGLYALYRNS